MGRFHVGAADAEDDHDEHDDESSSSPMVVAVSATSNPTVEAPTGGNKTDGDGDGIAGVNGDDEVELVGSEPWEDRCYADADADDNGREPVNTPPALLLLLRRSGAVRERPRRLPQLPRARAR